MAILDPLPLCDLFLAPSAIKNWAISVIYERHPSTSPARKRCPALDVFQIKTHLKIQKNSLKLQTYNKLTHQTFHRRNTVPHPICIVAQFISLFFIALRLHPFSNDIFSANFTRNFIFWKNVNNHNNRTVFGIFFEPLVLALGWTMGLIIVVRRKGIILRGSCR